MKLYRRYEGLSPIYQGYLTNHLPMYYQILREHNIDQKQMIEQLDRYKNDRDLYSLTDPMYPTSDFEQTYVQRTSAFLGEIHQYGTDIVVGNVLNDLKRGFHGHLFHGIIRLMYAVRSSYDLMIAQALSYLSLVVEEKLQSRPRIPLEDMRTKHHNLRQLVQEHTANSEGTTMDRFNELYHESSIQQALFEVENIDTHRQELLEWLMEEYYLHEGFFTLHAITGLHALFELEEYIVDFDDLLHQMVVAIQLFVAMDPEQHLDHDNTIMEWSDIHSNMTTLQEVHDVKLLFSLEQLAKQYHLPLAQKIASTIISTTKRY